MVERKFIVVTGTAGSGKTVLSSVLKDVIEESGPTAIIVNLDPAAKTVPYEPNVDVRDLVSYEDLMARGLGPNGAMIAAVDSLFFHTDEIRSRIEEYNSDYIIIDTPGQMELFAYRFGGPMLLKAIVGESPAVNVYLIDALFFEDPLSIVSALGLASSVALRFMLPQINVVSKADMLLPEILDDVIPRLKEQGFLANLVMRMQDASESTKYMAIKLLEALSDVGFVGDMLPVSSRDPESISSLYGRIQQVVSGGEEPAMYK